MNIDQLARSATPEGVSHNYDPAWLERFARLVADEERAACIQAVCEERVDALASGQSDDVAYNSALDHAVMALKARESHSDTPASFQARVRSWLVACFGPQVLEDVRERAHRFTEEALELAQACGCTADEGHQLVDYVFGRPVGERAQEAGSVATTLAALCAAVDIDLRSAAEDELARIWTLVEAIRQKAATKPLASPLPGRRPPETTQGNKA